jgi:hypothetical protein
MKLPAGTNSDDAKRYAFKNPALDAYVPVRKGRPSGMPLARFTGNGRMWVAGWKPPTSIWDIGEVFVDALEEVGEFIEEYGCALVNSGIIVSIVATGAGIVASPAAAAAVVTGASAGAAACAAIKIGEALYLIIKLLAHPIKIPKDLGQEAPPPDLPVGPPTTSAPATSTAKSAAGTIMGRKPVGIQTAPGTSQALLPLPATLPPAEIQPPPITATLTKIQPPPATLRPAAVFQWFDPSRNVWRIATPRSATLGGFGQPPQQYAVTESNKPEADVEIVTKDEGEKRTGTAPWYRTNKVWILIGAVAGVTAAGATTYYLVRRRRRATKGELKHVGSSTLRSRRMPVRKRLPR